MAEALISQSSSSHTFPKYKCHMDSATWYDPGHTFSDPIVKNETLSLTDPTLGNGTIIWIVCASTNWNGVSSGVALRWDNQYSQISSLLTVPHLTLNTSPRTEHVSIVANVPDWFTNSNGTDISGLSFRHWFEYFDSSPYDYVKYYAAFEPTDRNAAFNRDPIRLSPQLAASIQLCYSFYRLFIPSN